GPSHLGGGLAKGSSASKLGQGRRQRHGNRRRERHDNRQAAAAAWQ
ncbi:unnamed protein product, partial [Urochloa humidicola]